MSPNNRLPFPLLFLLGLLLLASPSLGAVVNPVSPPTETAITHPVAEDILRFNNRELADHWGRKLTFRERIGLNLLRGKLKRNARRIAKGKEPRDGMPVAALILGIVAFVFPLAAIPAIILGAIGRGRNRDKDPGRFKMASWGFWLGIGILTAYFILALFVIALFAGGGLDG